MRGFSQAIRTPCPILRSLDVRQQSMFSEPFPHPVSWIRKAFIPPPEPGAFGNLSPSKTVLFRRRLYFRQAARSESPAAMASVLHWTDYPEQAWYLTGANGWANSSP